MSKSVEQGPVHPAIVGIDSVAYGVEDTELGIRFFTDWGLQLVRQSPEQVVLRTRQGSSVVLLKPDSPDLPPPREEESSFRKVVWGVRTEQDLDIVEAALSEHAPVRHSDGTVHALDPFGYGIAFCVWRHHPIEPSKTLMNTPGLKMRISEPAVAYAGAQPTRIGHVVFEVSGVEDLRKAESFYIGKLGFSPSDRYREAAAFLRCAPVQDHHNIAFLDIKKGQTRFQHLAFEMRDIHEVFSGGLKFSEKGWETEIGPGRHKFSSAYFWYFVNPLGGQVEYFADMDYLDESWQPREPDPDPSSIAEWALPRGVRRFKGMRELKEQNS